MSDFTSYYVVELVRDATTTDLLVGNFRDIEFYREITLGGIVYGLLDSWVGRDLHGGEQIRLIYGAIDAED